MNWPRLQSNPDWQEFWECPEVRALQMKQAHGLLTGGEGTDQARGALLMMHRLQDLPALQIERITKRPVAQRTPLRKWIAAVIEQVRNYPERQEATSV